MSDLAADEARGPESVSVRDLTFRYPSGGYELEVPSFGVGAEQTSGYIRVPPQRLLPYPFAPALLNDHGSIP